MGMKRIISCSPRSILIVECRRITREGKEGNGRVLFLSFGELRRIRNNKPEVLVKGIKVFNGKEKKD